MLCDHLGAERSRSTFAARPWEPRTASRLVPPIAVPINARDVDREVRASCADRKALFLLPVLSSCATLPAPGAGNGSRHRTCRSDAPTTGADMTPQFRSGQTVRLSRGLPYKSAADGDYKIVRQLPDNGGENSTASRACASPNDVVKAMEKCEFAAPSGSGLAQVRSASVQCRWRDGSGAELTLKIRIDAKYASSLYRDGITEPISTRADILDGSRRDRRPAGPRPRKLAQVVWPRQIPPSLP